ncbi:hypothetical protein [Wukongibacter sp. M2B1]|uniref:hypothetical protein n=1 Tax=Wukongibacter sp. M2B1 TaxID=3088895 RepID=UPI003D7AD2E0
MKDGSIKKVLTILLFIALSLMSIACSPKNKDIVLSSDVKGEADSDKNHISVPVRADEVSEEKSILISDDVKKEAKKQEMETFRLEKLKELNINGKELDPVCWKDDENIIAFRGRGDNDHTYDIFNININTSKVTKINTIKHVVWRTNSTILHNKKVLYLNNLRFYTYDLLNDTTKEVYDLSNLKKEIEEEYRDYYINEFSNEAGYIYYEIVKRENEKDPKFNIKSDNEVVWLFDTNLVRESDKYISIITESPDDYAETIRILNIETGEIVKSKPFRYETLSLERLNTDGFIYNKSKDAFYMNGESRSIYEYRLSDPNRLQEIKEIKERLGNSNSFISGDEKNIYFSAMDEGGGSIVRYNIENDKLTIISKDKPEGVYFDINLNSKSNIISYNYYKRPFINYNDESYTFIGMIDGDKIRNIQKLPVEKLYDRYHNWNTITFNESGNKFIYKVAYNYEQGDIRDRSVKYYVYEIKNLEDVSE